MGLKKRIKILENRLLLWVADLAEHLAVRKHRSLQMGAGKV
jgi:hypothetical protein